METHKRSMVKSITWRIIGVFLLGGIAYSVTRNWKEMSIITILFHSIRMVLYYFHERIWLRVKWGKILHPLAEIDVHGKLTPEDLDEILQLSDIIAVLYEGRIMDVRAAHGATPHELGLLMAGVQKG